MCVRGWKVTIDGRVDELAPRIELRFEFAHLLALGTVLVVFAEVFILERLRDRLAFRIRENQLDFLFDFFEALMTKARQANAFFEELQRFVERQLFAFEPLHDFLELLKGFLEVIAPRGHRRAL